MKWRAVVLIGTAILTLVAQGQIVRENNSTLKFPTEITTSPGQYELKDLLPGLQFDRPVSVATPPGEANRLFVVERGGRVIVINDLSNPSKEVFLDISSQVDASDWQQNQRTEGLSSIAFHPNFQSNHRFFVSYNTITTTSAGTGHHNRVSEFRARADKRAAIRESEIPLITQFDEGDGHNINDLHFGPDGYLYIATGDEGDGGTGDDFNNAQKIDKDFFSALMRIDVDHRAGSLEPNPHPAANRSAYRIPADNPYIGLTSFNGAAVDPANIRTEFYAVGLRNPWRFSFDPQTSAIYEGDVGQHGREEINVIVKGGNYGWSFREGGLNGPKSAPPGFDSIAPIFEYGAGFGPDQGFSVTGGVVYRGSNVPGLFGHLIFADYVSGNLWTMNIDALPYRAPTRLLGQVGIAGFGFDPRNGDVLAVNHDQGKIFRLQYSSGTPDNIPTSLDQAGIFSSLATLAPHPGIYPYDVNVPLWSDDALKRRWFSIPAGKRIQFSPEGNWTLPTGSVWVKHFEIETKLGDPSTMIRLETRVLVKTDAAVYGLTYKWDDAGVNAALVPDGGDTRGLIINTGSTNRRQVWRFPSRSECLSCHTAAGGRILGFNTPQMNRDYGYGSVTTNQIRALSIGGFFENPPAHVHGLRALAPLTDTSSSREFRVRSYLAANCSFCHQPAANTYAVWDGRVTTPLTQASIVYGPLLNSLGPGTKVIAPGDTNLSAILTMMRSYATNRMPPVATSIPDQHAIQVITDWVAQDLPAREWYDAWAARVIGSGPNAAREADADGDGVSNYSEYLAGSDPLQRGGIGSMTLIGRSQGAIRFRHPANRGIIIESADTVPSSDWRVLDHSQNRLFFPATSVDRSVSDILSNSRKYYRLRVVEP